VYDFLRGTLAERSGDEVVLDIGGVGYRLLVSGATAGRLPPAGEATLFVHDMLRDERFTLYGFASREERALFLKLLGVSRIGPGTALTLLSALEPGALAAAVESGDTKALARIKGVGQRTAERLCVELRGRLGELSSLPGALTDRRAAVASALVALGYPRPGAQAVADAVCKGAPANAPLEELVKRALRALAAAPAAADPQA
jgi:holliday junction DNA helicase RuvA